MQGSVREQWASFLASDKDHYHKRTRGEEDAKMTRSCYPEEVSRPAESGTSLLSRPEVAEQLRQCREWERTIDVRGGNRPAGHKQGLHFVRRIR